MNSVKILFFDIDGTLVDSATGQIPASTREALLRLHEKGILLCIATGRPPASLPDLEGLPKASAAFTEKMREIDKSRLLKYCDSVDEGFMKTIDRSLKAALGLGHRNRGRLRRRRIR